MRAHLVPSGSSPRFSTERSNDVIVLDSVSEADFNDSSPKDLWIGKKPVPVKRSVPTKLIVRNITVAN